VDDDAAGSLPLNVGVSPLVREIRDVTAAELTARGQDSCLSCPAALIGSFTFLRRAARTTDDDLRSNSLTFTCLRLVAAFRPRHLAFENVPGLV
jgi:DNA (cytosine-5)-methyltransferase 1